MRRILSLRSIELAINIGWSCLPCATLGTTFRRRFATAQGASSWLGELYPVSVFRSPTGRNKRPICRVPEAKFHAIIFGLLEACAVSVNLGPATTGAREFSLDFRLCVLRHGASVLLDLDQ